MIKVTLADRSGFVFTTPSAILVFDYTRDPRNVLHKALEEQKDVPVIFFVSQQHDGHYSSEIYKLAQNHCRVYVLSNSVPGDTIPSSLGLSVANMSNGDVLSDLPGGISVKAYGISPRVTSFLVTTKEGKTIFFGGALTELYSLTGSDKKKKENKKDTPQAIMDRYRGMVTRIAEDYPTVDFAVLPVDVAEGVDYAVYAQIFMQKIGVSSFFPMDFGGERAEDACRFENYVPSTDTKGYCLNSPGKQAQVK